MPFDIFICLFPDSLPLPSHGGTISVFWVVLERNGFLPAESHIIKVAIVSHFFLLFLSRKERCQMIVHAVLPCTDNGLFIVTSAASKLLNLPTEILHFCLPLL